MEDFRRFLQRSASRRGTRPLMLARHGRCPAEHTPTPLCRATCESSRYAITYAHAIELAITYSTPHPKHCSRRRARCVRNTANHLSSIRLGSRRRGAELLLAALQQLFSALGSLRSGAEDRRLSPAAVLPASRTAEGPQQPGELPESWRCMVEELLHRCALDVARVHCGRIGDDQKGSEDRATVLQYIAPPNTSVAAPT